ncbi:MAG: ABC transporter permease [Bacillota bacterium]|jgi:putative ABC transport system permease protein
MGIILKFILNNIREKKFRTFLIIFTVTLSSALFFASLALSGTIEETFMAKIKKYIGTADLIIHSNEKSPFWMFRLTKTAVVKEAVDYVVGAVETSATYQKDKESVTINLKGYYLEDLAKLNPYVLAKQQDLAPFEGNKIIFSATTAQKYHFRPGDAVELKINKDRYRFKVAGIAQPTGLFQDDGQSNTAVAPRETLARLFGGRGMVGLAYIKLKAGQKQSAVIQKLKEEYRRYTVRELMSRAELRQYTQAITVPFFLMLVLVLFISIFIIYSSFKIITRERLPVIGTFRSIGATRKMTDLVLFAECIFYGVVGGICGCLLGLAILYGMAVMMRPEWIKNVKVVLTYNPLHLGAAFLLAVILPLLSALVPVVKTSRIPIKEIIFHTMERPKKKGFFRIILGLGFLLLVFTAPWLAPPDWALAVDVVCMLLAVTAAVLLVPVLTAGFLKLFEALYEAVLGNEGVLAAKNLRENKSIINNIALLAIGISSLLMINTISFSVVKELANFFKDADFDIWMGCRMADRKLTGVIRYQEGVSGVCGIYNADQVEIDGRKEKIGLIHGIDTRRYFDFWTIPLNGNRAALLTELDAGRNILLSYVLKERLGVEAGDSLTLKMKRGKRVYQVIGFFTSLMWSGSFAIVSERFLKSDMQLQYYGNIFVKTSKDAKLVAPILKKRLARRYPWMETLSEIIRQENENNRNLFLLLQGFAVLTLAVGIFGIFNNLLISFIERKRSLAMMRSLGMSKRQTLKIIGIESLTGGMIGGGIGIMVGTVLIWLIPFVLKAIHQVVTIHYSLKEYVIVFLFGVIIMAVASIGPALKSSRFNIIDAIKYE